MVEKTKKQGIKVQLTRSIIFAKDMKKMTAFYRDVLGLVPQPGKYTPDEWLAFDAGSVQLALHKIPESGSVQVKLADPPNPRWSAPTKLVFFVEDLENARDALLALDVKMMDSFNEPGEFVRCDFIDPEGNIFQLTVVDN